MARIHALNSCHRPQLDAMATTRSNRHVNTLSHCSAQSIVAPKLSIVNWWTPFGRLSTSNNQDRWHNVTQLLLPIAYLTSPRLYL